jgi:hypothetical protein
MVHRAERRVWIVVVAVAMTLALVGLLIPAIPSNESSASVVYLCARCGIRRGVEETATVDEPPSTLAHHEELLPTELSRWHADHYPEPCPHQWRLNHHVHRRYRRVWSLTIQQSAGMGSSVTPRLVDLSEQDADLLDALFEASPIVCEHYIEFCLKPLWERNSRPSTALEAAPVGPKS